MLRAADGAGGIAQLIPIWERGAAGITPALQGCTERIAPAVCSLDSSAAPGEGNLQASPARLSLSFPLLFQQPLSSALQPPSALVSPFPFCRGNGFNSQVTKDLFFYFPSDELRRGTVGAPRVPGCPQHSPGAEVLSSLLLIFLSLIS